MQKKTSQNYTVEAPLSFAGSARRLWLFSDATPYRVCCALLFIPTAWLMVFSWYCLFGLAVVPYRLIRRSQRKRNLEQLRHDELVARLGQ
jgi:hypothetical protein